MEGEALKLSNQPGRMRPLPPARLFGLLMTLFLRAVVSAA